MSSILIKNIGELATAKGNTAKKGAEQGEISILKNVCIGITNEKISYIGEEKNAPKSEVEIDAKGNLVTAGLVDSHTHLVFGGWRQNELALKLQGATYLEILKSGGGILSTVNSTRKAEPEELAQKTKLLLDEMLSYGTTTCEAKSGYGLSLQDELKQLQVLENLKATSEMEIVSTFMGAHAVPPEFKENREEYIELICTEMIPTVAKKELAEYCDIFCETGVFTVDESRKILQTAKQHGFKLKIHADEINCIGAADLASEVVAASAEHLIEASDDGIKKMSKSETIAVLLPATSFYLDKTYARARKMLEEGMSVAVATDFNPGSSPNLNLQLAMNLACLKYKLTPAEVLTAVTLNAAAAIGKSSTVGTLEVGKQADIVIWNAQDLNYILYRYGSNLVKSVIKKGRIAY